jgi:hypothetical protein
MAASSHVLTLFISFVASTSSNDVDEVEVALEGVDGDIELETNEVDIDDDDDDDDDDVDPNCSIFDLSEELLPTILQHSYVVGACCGFKLQSVIFALVKVFVS